MCTEHHWHHDYVRLAWDSGFCFDLHKSKTNLDWSSISIVDIDNIIKDRDIALVERHLTTITNYCLGPEHTKILDPTFVKVFRLSQLSVQYLQFCKRYLDNTVVLLKKELAKYREENENLKDYTEELKSEINDLKEKVKTLKDSLQNSDVLSENGGGFKCPNCLKLFLNEEYLKAHIKRRHETMTPLQSETDKLQLEIKELKERLNTTEKFVQSDHHLKTVTTGESDKLTTEEKITRVDLLIYKFDDLKQFIERELTTLKNEKCNDRYERWLEIVFKRLDNSKRELQNEKYGDVDILSTGDGYGEVKKVDNDTQTGNVIHKDSETMTEAVDDREVEPKSPLLEVDIKKIQEDLYANTENHLGQIQNALEQKLTGGLEQIQTQISTFYQKLNTIEAERALFKEHMAEISKVKCQISTPITNSPEPVKKGKNSEERPDPKPAPRITKSLPLMKEKKIVVAKRSAPKLESKPFMQTPLDSSTSDSCSYSSMSDDEKALFPIKTSKSHDDKITITKNNDRQKGVKLETLYESNVKKRDVSESDEDNKIEPPTRPSTSTLGRRSISSLKQAGKDKQVLAGLKNELEEMLCLRLKEVGVSPAWKRLPQKSYVRALGIVEHQAELITKKYPNYYKIREKLLKQVNTTLKKNCKKMSVAKKLKTEKKHKFSQESKRSKPRVEQKKNGESSSDNDYVTAPKEIESIENKPTSSTIKKKVLFDLEESSSISKDKVQVEEMAEPRRSKDKFPTLTTKTELVVIENEDVVKRPLQLKGNESGGSLESITSSILDLTKAQLSQKNKEDKIAQEEISDWEISDIY